MNCNTTHYRANSSSVPGDPTLAETSNLGALQFSGDAGGTWRTISVPTGFGVGVSIGPDKGFWLPGRASSEGQPLIRISKEGLVSTQSTAVERGMMSPPAWDSQGRMWVALIKASGGRDGTLAAIRLNADGSVAERVEAQAHLIDFPWMKFVGSKGYIAFTNATYELAGGKLTAIAALPSQGNFEFAQVDLFPQQSTGSQIVGYHAVTPDGGRSWVYTDRQQLGVQGNQSLLVRFPFTSQAQGVILRRCSPFVFCDTGVGVPWGTAAVWQADSGLVAVSTDSAGPERPIGADFVLAIDREKIPSRSPDLGRASRHSRALVARINKHRRDAGLPPLIHDARMSAAALSHARYLQRHVRRGRLDIENAHKEVPGQRGFTGVDAQARCTAKKTVCNGEEVIPGRRPSDTIVSLYYHRINLMSPYAQYIGAATAGPYTVYEVDPQRAAFVTKPTGYPSGRYAGPLQLQDVEAPDPYALCRTKSGPFPDYTRYDGVPITFTPPGREPSRPHPNRIEIRTGPDTAIADVRLFIGKRQVPGCLNSGTFMPRPALRPHTTYTAKARWRPSPQQGFRTYTWKFRTR